MRSPVILGLFLLLFACKKQDSTENELPLEEVHGKILYTEGLNLVEMDIQTGIAKEIENGLGVLSSWSPDGNLLMWSDRITNGAVVIKVTDSQGNLKLEFENPDIHHSCWSPDGKKIAFFNYEKEIVTKIDLTTMVRDTFKYYVSNVFWQPGTPDWSPDEKTFVFTAHQTDDGVFNIWRIDSNGENLIKLTEGGAWHPQWSPSGQEIAYANAYSLKTMSSDGKNHKSLIVGGSSPHWSSDGKLLMYQLQKEANVGSKGFEIRVRNLETGQERLLVEHATLLDWHSFE